MTSDNFPYLRFALRIGQQSYNFDALIDTGFDGGFAVPQSFLEGAGPPQGYARWEPVVGPPVLAATYDATFQIDTLGPFPVTVTALGDEMLVDLEVINRFSITLDHGQRVVVGP